MSKSKDVPNSRDTTNAVRPELVEGFATDEKARFFKLRDEFHTFLRQPNLYDERDKTHQLSVLLAAGFADFQEGFYAICMYELRLTQAPALLLRGMFEGQVKLLYLAAVVNTRNDNPSELLRRADSLLLNDFESKKKLDAEVERVHKLDNPNETLPKAAFDYDASVKNLTANVTKGLSVENMIVAIDNLHSRKAYLTYRFLSQRAHPMIEGMGAIWNTKTGKISVFKRTDDEMNMWCDCASEFTEGALFALKQLLTAVRTEPVEVSANPSTSSGRTDFGRTGVV